MAKNIIWSDEARMKLKAGVDKVANAVKITVGPRGRNVVLDKGYGSPTITNDGVSIAKEISLSDKFENMGAEIVKEVASKTNEMAGDGTTTSVILMQAIVSEGMKHTAMGVNAMALRNGIEKAAKLVVESLKSIAKTIKTKDEIRQVATISAESQEIGTIIADTIEKVGKDGVVTVEESQLLGIQSDVVEGLEFDKGYVSPYMITNAERMEAEYRDAAILITDKKISAVKEILPLLEKIVQTGKKDIVLIAEDIEGEALTTFILNKLRGGLNVLAIKAPGYGDRKKELLADIALTVGAQVITDDVGLTFEKAGMAVLGHAARVLSNKDRTIIVDGKGKKADIEKRVAQLKVQRDSADSKFDKEKLDERIAKLSGGVAVIRVGAATETEMKYLKLKIEDAVNATKAAIEEGIVAGGGVAFIQAGKKIESSKEITGMIDEEEIGFGIVFKALEAPIRQIAFNAGRDDDSIVKKIKNPYEAADKKNDVPTADAKKRKENFGFNALKNDWEEDMIKAGIIDPVKVARLALQNAASAASILLTTEVAVADEPEEKKPASMGGMPGGMGGMDY